MSEPEGRFEVDLTEVTVVVDLVEHGRVEINWPRFTRGDDVHELGAGAQPDWVEAAVAKLGLVDDDVRRRALEDD